MFLLKPLATTLSGFGRETVARASGLESVTAASGAVAANIACDVASVET